jgi:CRP-like cAMP-binding protein
MRAGSIIHRARGGQPQQLSSARPAEGEELHRRECGQTPVMEIVMQTSQKLSAITQGMPCGYSRQRFRLPMTRFDIADYLGLTIKTISRTFTRLRTARATEHILCL